MTPRPHKSAARPDHEMREQEVLRAKRELMAYFSGRRTEREARAALKIIKAFVRERERTAPAGRRPLPIVPGRTLKSESAKRKPAARRRNVRSRVASPQTEAAADSPPGGASEDISKD